MEVEVLYIHSLCMHCKFICKLNLQYHHTSFCLWGTVCLGGRDQQTPSITCLLVDYVHCVGVIQVYAPSSMFLCHEPCLCLPSSSPIHSTGLRANMPHAGWRAGRAGRQISDQLGSNSVQLVGVKKKTSHKSISSADWVSLSDLPLAPEKLEALISLDTGLWGFLFALAAFLTYQSPPPLPVLCFLCPGWPPQSSSPLQTVTVAVGNVVIDTCMVTPICCVFISRPKDRHFVLNGQGTGLNWMWMDCSPVGVFGSLLCFPSPLQVSSLVMLPLCEFRCVITWLLPLIHWHVEGNSRKRSRKGFTGWKLQNQGASLYQCCCENLFLTEHWSWYSSLRMASSNWSVPNHNFQQALAVFQGPTWPTLHEASQKYSQSLFNHSVRIIQRVSAFDSVSVCPTLPFSLCVGQHGISKGYPLPDSNNTTSWWKLREVFLYIIFLCFFLCSWFV